VLVSTRARSIAQFPPCAHVGTGSPRRQSQILAARPDLTVDVIRGNIDTRLRKLWNDEWDGIILAMAGLRRAGLFDHLTMTVLGYDEMLPAAGQGALALQCRRDDSRARDLLASLNDPATEECVTLERAVVAAVQGDCHSPIAALATVTDDVISLRVAVGSKNCTPHLYKAAASASRSHPEEALASVMELLLDQGYAAAPAEYDPEAPIAHTTA
jgi:hydroxymethylbilane synthase